MAKKKEKFLQSSRSNWLKLSLELIAVFVEGFSTDNREFKNITAGYYILAQQRMNLLQEVDSVSNALIPLVVRARK